MMVNPITNAMTSLSMSGRAEQEVNNEYGRDHTEDHHDHNQVLAPRRHGYRIRSRSLCHSHPRQIEGGGGSGGGSGSNRDWWLSPEVKPGADRPARDH